MTHLVKQYRQFETVPAKEEIFAKEQLFAREDPFFEELSTRGDEVWSVIRVWTT